MNTNTFLPAYIWITNSWYCLVVFVVCPQISRPSRLWSKKTGICSCTLKEAGMIYNMRTNFYLSLDAKLVLRDLVISVFRKASSVLVKINNLVYNEESTEFSLQDRNGYSFTLQKYFFWHLQTNEDRFSERRFLKTITILFCYRAFLPTVWCNDNNNNAWQTSVLYGLKDVFHTNCPIGFSKIPWNGHVIYYAILLKETWYGNTQKQPSFHS